MIYVDVIKRQISGNAKVSDIRKYGLIKATMIYESLEAKRRLK